MTIWDDWRPPDLLVLSEITLGAKLHHSWSTRKHLWTLSMPHSWKWSCCSLLREKATTDALHSSLMPLKREKLGWRRDCIIFTYRLLYFILWLAKLWLKDLDCMDSLLYKRDTKKKPCLCRVQNFLSSVNPYTECSGYRGCHGTQGCPPRLSWLSHGQEDKVLIVIQIQRIGQEELVKTASEEKFKLGSSPFSMELWNSHIRQSEKQNTGKEEQWAEQGNRAIGGH